MRIVGRYTAALLLLGIGLALLSDIMMGTKYVSKIMDWWPVLVIAFGLEYLLLAGIGGREGQAPKIAVGLLLTAVIVAIAVTFVAGATSIDKLFEASPSNQIQRDPLYIEMMNNPEQLRVEHRLGGNITVQSGDVDRIQVDATIVVRWVGAEQARKTADRTEIITERHNGTISIETERQWYTGWLFWNRPRVDFVITIPEDRSIDIDLGTRNGKLQVSSITANERMVLNTTNGSISLIDVAGEITANTTNGRVLAQDVRGSANLRSTNGQVRVERIDGPLEVRTTNGKIELDGAMGSVSLKTTNGAVDAVSPTMGGDWDLTTTNGALRLILPESGGYRVEGRTTNGGVTTNLPLEVSKNKMNGSVGDGRYDVRLRTTNGRLTLNSQP